MPNTTKDVAPASARITLLAWSVAAQLETATPPIPISNPVEVQATHNQTLITLALRPRDWQPPGDAEDDTPSMCRDFMFSPLEQQVVRYLAQHGAAKGATLGRHVACLDSSTGQAGPKLKILLANLVDRNVLTNDDNGYSLAPSFVPLARQLGLLAPDENTN